MAQGLPDAVSTDNPVFRAYLFYCGILILKMMLMTILTARQRIKHKAFANEEDAKNLKVKVRVDENVERVRRAHLNDLENIPLFFVGAFIYTLTNPSEYVAKSLFLAYTIARIVHTFVYAVYVVPQPARGLSFGVGVFITGYMIVIEVNRFVTFIKYIFCMTIRRTSKGEPKTETDTKLFRKKMTPLELLKLSLKILKILIGSRDIRKELKFADSV